MAQDLTKLFNQFAGKEIPMVEKTRKIGPNVKGVYLEVNLADPKYPVLQEMEKVAKDNGLQLRLLWQGVVGTMDLRNDRITAYIKKGTDGKYRVSDKFKIG